MPNTPELDALVAKFVADINSLVQQSVAERVGSALDGFAHRLLGAPVVKTVAPATADRRAHAAPQTNATPTGATQRKVRLCPVFGCGKPAAGPKYQWKCRDHGALKTAKQPVAPPALSTPAIVLPQPKTATVIPPHVPVTRLPPGPMPKAKQPLPEVAKLCRLPGCRNKHSGPRYDLFCRDHYATLNAEERMKYKAAWKAAHTTA